MPEEIRTGEMLNSDLGAAQAMEAFLSHAIARAIEAVCLLMAHSLDLEMLMQATPSASSAYPTTSFAKQTRMNEAAWHFDLKTAGTELPSRS